MGLKPIYDKVLVRRVEEETKTVGGIIIPDNNKEKPMKGEVVAVGNGRLLKDGTTSPLIVKAGDKILFGKYTGTEVKFEGQEYLVIKEEEILAVIA